MNKGFVKIFEVILAISIIFIVINNIYSALPPAYQDAQGINRLQRYAGDIASSICYSQTFRENTIKGYIPINLTLYADAWNKSNSSRYYDTSADLEGTARQTTYFNRSASKIKICIETDGAMNSDIEFSICEKDTSSNYYCKINTLSEDHVISAPTSAGLWCTEWFNYSVNKNKVYLVNDYVTDGDYLAYYTNGQNGFWWCDGADTTQQRAPLTTCYDYSTYPETIHVYGYYDLGLNQTLANDLNYHIWLYSNNSADGKLDDLINESGKETSSTLATASCLISSYEKEYSPKKIVVGIWNRNEE